MMKLMARVDFSPATVQRKLVICIVMMMSLLGDPRDARAATYNVLTYGATGNGTTDDSAAVKAAIQAAVAAGSGNTVYFPTGSYYLHAGWDSYALIDLIGVSNLTIQGDAGATEIFSGDYTKVIFNLQDCTNVTLNNIMMDVRPLLFTQGTIISITSTTVTTTIDPGYGSPTSLSGTGQIFRVFTDPNTIAYDQTFEPTITSTATSGSNWVFGVSVPPPGDIVGKKFFYWQGSGGNWAICLNYDSNILVENVSYYGGGGGAAFSAGHSTGPITLSNFYCGIPPGSNRVMATEGGSQTTWNRSTLTITDCDFNHIDDDGVNSGGGFEHILSSPSSTQVVVNYNDEQYQPNDLLYIWDWTQYEQKVRDEAEVTSAVYNSSANTWLLNLDRPVTILKTGPDAGGDESADGIDRLIDQVSSGSVFINNSRFSSSRSRPIIIKSPNTTIENSYIYDSPSPGIAAGTDVTDNEGPQLQNLTLIWNTIEDIDPAGIDVGVYGSRGSRDNTNIDIEHNTFLRGGQHTGVDYSPPGVGLRLRNANGATIAYNTFDSQPNASIVIQDSENVQVNNNLFRNTNESFVQYPSVYQTYLLGSTIDGGSVVWIDNSQTVSLSANTVSNLGSWNTIIGEATATCSGVTGLTSGFATATNGNLPVGWQDTDINSGNVFNLATYSGGIFTVEGSGSDIWNTADGFNYAYYPLNGNGTIIARVASIEDTDPYAKAGLMVRENFTPGSRFACLALNPGGTTQFLYRSTANQNAQDNGDVSVGAPTWLKLVRAGDVISGYYSSNGTAWTAFPAASVTLTGLTTTVQVGLPVCSHNPSLVNTSTFSNVKVTGGNSLAGNWADVDVNYPSTSGSASLTHGTYTIAGSGSDIFNSADQFNYSFTWMNGNGTFIGKVASLTNTSPYAKAGIMLREDLTPGSRFVMPVVVAGGEIELITRTTADQNATQPATISGGAPQWLKLVRSGTTVTTFYSANGTTWTAFPNGTITLSSLATKLCIGLAVCSCNVNTLNTATFTNVTGP